MKKHTSIISILLLLFVTSTSFYPSLKNDFTNWDDKLYVTENTTIKSLSLKNIKENFSSFYVSNYLPLTMLSYSLEYLFCGLNPFCYHLTNLILHLLNCLLVFWLVCKLRGSIISALVTALLFGIHPLHVESVAWVAERKDVLYSFFFLSAVICYIFYLQRQAVKYNYFSVLLFVLSLFSKPMAVSLPFVLIVCDYIFQRKFDRHSLLEKAPFWGLALVFGIIAILAQQSGGAIREDNQFTLLHNILIAGYGLVFYLVKMAAPIQLSCLYPAPDRIADLFSYRYLIAPVIVALVSIVVIFSGRYTRKVRFGCMFFFFTILPVLQLMPIGHAMAADRYTYIPSIGIFYLAGEGFCWLYRKALREKKVRNLLPIVSIVIVIGMLSLLTWNRCYVWQNSITLWSDVLRKYPDAAIACNNRGNAYFHMGEIDKAIADYNQALKSNPNFQKAYNNRGRAYLQRGKYEEAIADYTRSLRIAPNHIAFSNRGDAYFKQREYDKAIADYTQALQIDQAIAEVYNNRGVAYGKKGAYDKAIADYTHALRIEPNCATFNNRGYALLEKGAYNKAIADFTQALSIDSHYAEALNNRSLAYGKKTEYDKAIADATQALKINPNFSEAYNNRGNAYLSIDEYDKAIADYTQALRIDPSFAGAYSNRAVSYFMKKEYDKAWEDVKQMQDLGRKANPQFLKLLMRFSGRQH